MKTDLLQALEGLIVGANDVLGHFSADGIVDDLSQAMDGLREDVKHAETIVASTARPPTPSP